MSDDIYAVLASRFAGAVQAQRLYAKSSPVLKTTIDGFHQSCLDYFRTIESKELTFALVGDDFAVSGQLLRSPTSTVLRLQDRLVERGFELIACRPDVSVADLLVLVGFLAADGTDVIGQDGDAYLQERGIRSIAIKYLALAKSALGEFGDLYQDSISASAGIHQDAAKKGMVDMRAVQGLAKNLYEMITKADTPVATIAALRDRGDSLHIHATNVALFTGLQAQALGWGDDAVRQACQAGLGHDLGKTRLPDGLLFKLGNLSAKERELMDSHTGEGARILFRTQGGLSAAAIVCAEHHLPWHEQTLSLSQLVSVADAFDSIRTLVPFSTRIEARQAFFILQNMPALNPYLVERFGALLGVLDIGDAVRLATGEVARVIETTEIATRPRVQVLDTALGTLPVGTYLEIDGQQASISLSLASEKFVSLDPATVAELG